MKNKLPLVMLCCMLFACSGSGDEPTPPTPPTPPDPVENKIPINLSLGVNTRATTTAFEASDRIGLYVVNYNAGSAGTLQTTGNHVDNAKFTYTAGSWTPDSQLYWKDETTKADFYCFYPYAAVSNVAQHTFTLNDNQSTAVNYNANVFLWGKTAGVSPTASAVSITTRNVFSNVIVKVQAGEGFTEAQLAAATVSVKLGQIKTGASINLSTGVATATGSGQTIVPFTSDGKHQALVVPQTISAEDFITVTVDGRDYMLSKDFTFVANTQHTFTVTVTRTSSGINVGIGSWENDDIDHGGIAQ